MSTLSKYVERKNRMLALFQDRQLDVRDPGDRKIIAEMIDGDLSPENLTQDGELAPAQVRARRQELIKVAEDLRRLDKRVGFKTVIV